MRRLKGLLSTLAAVVLMLCSTCIPIIVKTPAGDEPVHLRAYNWEGIWMPYGYGSRLSGNFEMAKVTVLDPEKGHLRAEITKEGKAGLQVTTTDLYVRKAGGWMLVSMPLSDIAGAAPFKGYIWGRAELNNNILLVWAPGNRFYDSVQRGVVEGRIHYEKPETHGNPWVEIERLDTQVLEQLRP